MDLETYTIDGEKIAAVSMTQAKLAAKRIKEAREAKQGAREGDPSMVKLNDLSGDALDVLKQMILAGTSGFMPMSEDVRNELLVWGNSTYTPRELFGRFLTGNGLIQPFKGYADAHKEALETVTGKTWEEYEPKEYLSMAFWWKDTTEGQEYWSQVNDQWERVLKQYGYLEDDV